MTHLDANMGAAVSGPQFLKICINIVKEFNLPVLLDGRVFTMGDQIGDLLNSRDVIIDPSTTKLPEDQEKGTVQYYFNLFKSLKPGLTCLLIHLACDDTKMQAATIDHSEWGRAWRQDDYDFFASKESSWLLKENKIVLLTWRELRDKIVRAPQFQLAIAIL